MNQARTHRSRTSKRAIRAAKTGSARQAIGQLEEGCNIYILTFGQFSLIDALIALVEQTGPADVNISTWVAANADLTIAESLLRSSQIRSMRFVVDHQFEGRQERFLGTLRELFGDDCIRSTRNHAKFITITNDRWHLVVRTSMNLNHNPRLENIEISDDPDLSAFIIGIVDDLFQEQPPGQFGYNPNDPVLASAPDVGRTGVRATRLDTAQLRFPSIGARTSASSFAPRPGPTARSAARDAEPDSPERPE